MILFNLNTKKQQHNRLPFHEVLLVVLSDALKPFGYRENVGWSLGHVHGETPSHPLKHKSYINKADLTAKDPVNCIICSIYLGNKVVDSNAAAVIGLVKVLLCLKNSKKQ
jgi:hypothetical protein